MSVSELKTPEERALAAQWLLEQQIEKLHARMPPELFVDLALSIDHLLVPWVHAAEK